jgi:glycosyltransferase involved in cell wall biosynthesis
MSDPLSVAYLLGPNDPLTSQDVLALARHYARRDHRVVVIGPLARSFQGQLEDAGARWVDFSLPADESHARWRSTIQRLRRLLRSLDLQILHVYGLRHATAALLALTGVPDAPLVVSAFSGVSHQKLTMRRRLAVELILRQSAAVTVTTATDKDFLGQINRKLGKRVRLIPNGVELRNTSANFDAGEKRQALGVRPDAAVVGVLSPAIEELGFPTFFAAAERLSEEFPSVEFLIVGDGRDQRKMQLQVHNLGLGGATVFKGDRVDTVEIVASLNVLAVPRAVPASIGHVLQAFAHDIHVVAEDSPGLHEIMTDLDPQGLVPPDDAEALRAAIAAKLEIEPPEQDESALMDDGRLLTVADMTVANEYLDLDTADNQLTSSEELNSFQKRFQRLARRYSTAAMIRATDRLYRDLRQHADERPAH